MIRKLLTTAAVVAGVTVAGQAQAELPKTLNFGIISTESSQGLKKSFGPFLDDMAKKLGVEVKPFFATDYAGIIEAMRFKKVDIAWYGNKSAMEAVDRAEGEVFVQTVDVTGNPGYWSLLIAHKDSPLNSLEDVLKCDKSINFGIGDPNSTSGFLVPSYYVFAKNNVDPKNCFKTVRSSNHEGNALAVASKQVDVATNNTESLLARLKQNKPDAFNKIKILWKSPLIPNDPIVWRSDLSKEAKAAIKGFFLSYGRVGANAEAEREILAGVSSGWAPFHASSNAQLYPIRQLQLFREKTKLNNDERMAAADKSAKIAEIDRKLETLKVLDANQLAIK